MSWLEELVEGAREDARRRQQDVPLESLQQRLGSREGARPFNEALLLRLAYAYQQETNFNQKRPRLT